MTAVWLQVNFKKRSCWEIISSLLILIDLTARKMKWLTIICQINNRNHQMRLICEIYEYILTVAGTQEYGTTPAMLSRLYARGMCTVYPKKYAHGFVVLCFVVVMQSFIMNSHEIFIHIHQGCFAGTGAIVRLPQCQWSKPDGYGKLSQCITTTKHISWNILYNVLWINHMIWHYFSQ